MCHKLNLNIEQLRKMTDTIKRMLTPRKLPCDCNNDYNNAREMPRSDAGAPNKTAKPSMDQNFLIFVVEILKTNNSNIG